MNKTYLFLFGTDLNRDEVTKFLDTQNDMLYWFYNLPNSVFINSRLDSRQISEEIESKFGQITHIVVQVTNKWGRLPKEHWQHFQD